MKEMDETEEFTSKETQLTKCLVLIAAETN